jgi:hypothetical protein
MKRLAKALAAAGALTSVLASGHALAWGSDGHRVVGAIADQLISGTPTQQRVAALLQPGESLEMLAVWADCVKTTAPASCGPQTEEMKAFLASNPGQAGYHYTDVPFQLEHYQDHALGTRADDIVQILRQAIGVLQGHPEVAGNPHQFTPRQALLMLAHLVGDLHQPLHVSGAYVARDGGLGLPTERGQLKDGSFYETRGGQDLLVNTERNLHTYWDFVLVDAALRRAGVANGPDAPRHYAAKVIEAGPLSAADTGAPERWPYAWADAALAASKPAFRGLALGPKQLRTDDHGVQRLAWQVTLPPDYEATESAVAERQLVQGGYHLAELLMALFP